MISALVAFAIAQTMTLSPSDDIWIYPHAADGAGDTFLRVWGSGGKSVPSDAGEAEDFSMGYLKFSLAGTPAGLELSTATLEVTSISNPGYTPDQTKYAPLEARSIPANFEEKGWDYSKLSATLPKVGIDSLFGSTGTATGNTISIDLLKGPGGFAKALDAAQKSSDKTIAIALTSSLDPSELGRSAVYKVYSKEADDKASRPKLILTWK
jgi:hypothetical protein